MSPAHATYSWWQHLFAEGVDGRHGRRVIGALGGSGSLLETQGPWIIRGFLQVHPREIIIESV